MTAREHEVAGLVAAGQTNRDIAEMLISSEGTAAVHLKHILNQLGFKSWSWRQRNHLDQRHLGATIGRRVA